MNEGQSEVARENVEPDVAESHRRGAVWTWPTRYRWGGPLLFAAVAAAYGLGSEVAMILIEASALQGVLFIPAGITVAFLLRLTRRSWWIVLLAAGLTEFAMDVASGFSIRQASGFALANVVEPLVGALVVTAVCQPLDLARRRDVLWFTLGAVIVGPAVGAAVGAGTDRIFGGDALFTTFVQWWLGDALGVILVGSAILAWGSSPDRRSLASPWGALLIVGSVALTGVVLGLSDLPLVFSVLVGVVVAGVFFGVRAVAMTALAVALTIAVLLAIDPGALIVGLDPSEALVLIKLQVGTFALAGLVIAAESYERDLATERAARAALETESMERDRRRDRDLAVRVQKGLLPDRLLARPGLALAARYEAASDALEVGGDWYDTFELRDGRIGIVVGDVVGHGIDAMISMGRLRTALNALAIHNQDPASLLTELDEFVGGPDGTAYATVFYVIVDMDKGVLSYASAGHPPGLLITPEKQAIWLDQGHTEPLYGRPSSRRQATVALDRGATLILYSDGLVEQRGEALDVGLGRLEHCARDLADESPERVCDRLFEHLAGGMVRSDDVVVVAMRFATDAKEFYEAVPARPDELRRLRSSIRAWTAERGIAEEVRDDLILAVGEATSNVVRHAYRDSPSGDMTVRIAAADGTLTVEITDKGRWRDSVEGSEPGMGTGIIRSLSDGFDVVSTTLGTSIRFQIPAYSKGQAVD